MSHELALTEHVTEENALTARNHLKTLDDEITCLARQIKIWMLIASRKKEGTISAECDGFFGWEHTNSLRQFAIDGLKIADDGRRWAISAIDILDTERERATLLIKNSRLQDRLSKLHTIMSPLREWRNKRHAHLEPTEIENVSLNLQTLYDALANLRNSVGYIQHYMTNPHYIVSNKWDIFTTHDTEPSNSQSQLDRYFKTDPTIMSLEKVLNACSKQTSTILKHAELISGEFQKKVSIR